MAKYTMYLKDLCDFTSRESVENYFKDYNLHDFLTAEQIESIENFGVWSASKLAKKIVDHYYMNEIGQETPALFKHYAKVMMNEIMEEKLPLIYSASIKYDPLVNVDVTESFTRDIDGTSHSNGTSNSSASNNASGLNVASDTPQGQISKSDILAGSYASQTNASETESSTTDSTTTNNNGTSSTNETYTKTTKGNSGVSATAQKMIEQYRQNIVAIDKQIIESLNPLFMGLF